MRKGFTLVETLVVVLVLPFMLLVLDGLFATLITDIPRSYKIVQTNTTLLNMLEQLRRDVDKAKELPEGYNDYISDDETLLINLPEGIVCYQLKDEKVVRHNLKDESEDGAAEQKYWPAPRAKVRWKVWRKDAAGYAVEVSTFIEQKVHGHRQKKMTNSRVYFLDVL
jgi:prepilin-type N-terminal cleavage/methylation domain-containing protein